MPFPSDLLFPGDDVFPQGVLPQPFAVARLRSLASAATPNLSGIVSNQNLSPAGYTEVDDVWRLQEFEFPSDYRRGTDAGEQRYPTFSGLQLCLRVDDASAIEIEFRLERQVFGVGWVQEATGSVSGAHAEGDKVWVDLYLDRPLEISGDALGQRWRYGFRGTAPGAWGSVPNPLAIPHGLRAYEADGVTPLLLDGSEFSYMFRLLALVADEGIDFLGDSYRSVVISQDAGNVTTGQGSNDDTFWLSKPNPSKFAIESLYFDQRSPDDGEGVVVDALILDPITPGVYFHLYYTDEGDPGSSPEEWDQKLWRRVPETFQATKRERHVLPEPVKARYFKIEFSHLQAQYYRAGDFAQPIAYKKHPKWVLDYFLLRYSTDNLSASQRVGVIWDTLDLAYNYYLDDIRQEPLQPVAIDPGQVSLVTDFLRSQGDVSDQVDQATLDKINTTLQPFAENPATRASYDFLLGSVVRAQAREMDQYPAEQADPLVVRDDDVSSLNREAVVFEQSYPVMFFYLTCRHAYREVVASLSHDRAYFVGVREVAFTRERYTAAHDTLLYTEPALDQGHVEYNDFEAEDDQWVVYV